MERTFTYCTGETVLPDDRIRADGKMGRVAEIMQPNTQAAKDCDCPEGAVSTTIDWDGKDHHQLWLPPDGEWWEDLEFLERAHEK